MKSVESFESKKEELSGWQKEILSGIGVENIETLKSWVEILEETEETDSKTLEFFQNVLQELTGEKPTKRERVPAQRPTTSEKEAEEFFEALRHKE